MGGRGEGALTLGQTRDFILDVELDQKELMTSDTLCQVIVMPLR